MSCKDCKNNVPDRTVDLGCGGEPLEINTIDQITTGPSTSDVLGKIDATNVRRPLDAVKYVSSAVKDISVRFGKVQPGLFFTEADAEALNRQVGVVFDDIESGLTDIIDKMKEREIEINNQISDQIKKEEARTNLSDISKPCENIFKDFNFTNPGLDWENPIANSPVLELGTCRLVTGCQFCDLPGDINIPPFPGVPFCNFTPVKSQICGFEFFDPIGTISSVVNGFQLFATNVGAFVFAFVDLANLATGFLGRCIIRILDCFTEFYEKSSLLNNLNSLTSDIRQTITATTAYINSRAAAITTVLQTIKNIVRAALGELFRFATEVLNMCDPCKITEAITNPASLPALPSI